MTVDGVDAAVLEHVERLVQKVDDAAADRLSPDERTLLLSRYLWRYVHTLVNRAYVRKLTRPTRNTH